MTYIHNIIIIIRYIYIDDYIEIMDILLHMGSIESDLVVDEVICPRKIFTAWMPIFGSQVIQTPDATLLSQHQEHNPVIQCAVVSDATRFSLKDVQCLREHYVTRFRRCGEHEVDFDALACTFQLENHPKLLRKIFGVNFQSFVMALDIAVHGSEREAQSWVFQLFNDENTDDHHHEKEDDSSVLNTRDFCRVIHYDLTLARRRRRQQQQPPDVHHHHSNSNSNTTTTSQSIETCITEWLERQLLCGSPRGTQETTRTTTNHHHLNHQERRPRERGASAIFGQLELALELSESPVLVSKAQIKAYVDHHHMMMMKHDDESSDDDGQQQHHHVSLSAYLQWLSSHRLRLALVECLVYITTVEFGCRPASRQQELEIVQRALVPMYPDTPEYELVEDDRWYLVSLRWWQRWCRMLDWTEMMLESRVEKNNEPVVVVGRISNVDLVEEPPPPQPPTFFRSMEGQSIRVDDDDDDDLFDDLHEEEEEDDLEEHKQPIMDKPRRSHAATLRPHLVHKRDYVIINASLWKAIYQWYEGGPEIERVVIECPDGSYALDIYEDILYDDDDDDDRSTTREDHRLRRLGSPPPPLLSSSSSNIQRLLRRRRSTLSTPSPRASMPQSLQSSSSSSSVEKKKPVTSSIISRIRSGGSAGLHNIGNTCYMNSALQCLVNTELLTEYFLSGFNRADVNTTSALGHHGELARVFGQLVVDMWQSHEAGGMKKNQPLRPTVFKRTIGEFHEDFAGQEQQDAQEFLAFVLSGLSEDLNRITDPPYVLQPDSDGLTDQELADDWWRNHLRREVSIIVALFTGQYKSLLTCRACAYESARFEPFTFLQGQYRPMCYLPTICFIYHLQYIYSAYIHHISTYPYASYIHLLLLYSHFIYK